MPPPQAPARPRRVPGGPCPPTSTWGPLTASAVLEMGPLGQGLRSHVVPRVGPGVGLLSSQADKETADHSARHVRTAAGRLQLGIGPRQP